MPPAPASATRPRWLQRLLEHAWAHAPGVRRRLERAGLAPDRRAGRRRSRPAARHQEERDAGSPEGRSAVRRVLHGAASTESAASSSRPGPILEPMGPEVSAWHAETGLYAGGFRPGDVVVNTFLYQLVPAAHELDEALNLVGLHRRADRRRQHRHAGHGGPAGRGHRLRRHAELPHDDAPEGRGDGRRAAAVPGGPGRRRAAARVAAEPVRGASTAS